MEVLCVVVVPVLMAMAWGVHALVASAARDEALLAEKAHAEALRACRALGSAEPLDERALREALERALPRSLYERVRLDELARALRE